VPVAPLDTLMPELLKEPGRNTLLFGDYGVLSYLPPLLATQNLDPQSPWFGAIHSWRTMIAPATRNSPR